MENPRAGRFKLKVEASKSLTGKHAYRSVVLVYTDKSSPVVVSDPNRGEQAPRVYRRGSASWVTIRDLLEGLDGEKVWIVRVGLARNPQLRIKGVVEVYDSQGNLLLRATVRKRKVRRSCGDPGLKWLVEDALSRLGLSGYIRKINFGTGGSGECRQGKSNSQT